MGGICDQTDSLIDIRLVRTACEKINSRLKQIRMEELVCTECGWRRVVSVAEKITWLQSLGMLRREKTPDLAIVEELFKTNCRQFTCRICKQVGLSLEAASIDDEQWGDARRCEVCRKAIPVERLEALPNTKICVVCQENEDTGATDNQPDYCERCGEVLFQRATSRGGITRYEMRCPVCR